MLALVKVEIHDWNKKNYNKIHQAIEREIPGTRKAGNLNTTWLVENISSPVPLDKAKRIAQNFIKVIEKTIKEISPNESPIIELAIMIGEEKNFFANQLL